MKTLAPLLLLACTLGCEGSLSTERDADRSSDAGRSRDAGASDATWSDAPSGSDAQEPVDAHVARDASWDAPASSSCEAVPRLSRSDARTRFWFTAQRPFSEAGTARYLVETQGDVIDLALDVAYGGAVHSEDGITHPEGGFRFLRVASESRLDGFGVRGSREPGAVFFHQLAPPLAWAGRGGDGSTRRSEYGPLSDAQRVGESVWTVRSFEALEPMFDASQPGIAVGDFHHPYLPPSGWYPYGPTPVAWFWSASPPQLDVYLRTATPPATRGTEVGHASIPVARGIRYYIVERLTMSLTSGRYECWVRAGMTGAVQQIADYTGPLGYIDPADEASSTHYPQCGLYDFTAPLSGTYASLTDGTIMVRDDAGATAITPRVMMDTLACD